MEAFWAAYRERVNTAIKRSFRVPLVVPVATSHAPTLGPILASYAAFAEQALNDGRWITARPAGLNLFRRKGSSWTVIYEGELDGRPDAVGLFYLRLLLEHPGSEMDVRAPGRTRGLWLQDRSAPLREPLIQTLKEVRNEDRGSVGSSPANDLGAFADEDARRDYEARAEQLNDQIRAAEETRDPDRRDRLADELRQINRQLVRSRGLGRKPRLLGEEHKRVYVGEAVEGFREGLPALHRHLESALRLGRTCCYNPAAPINWQF